jgi:hypothetical protein
MSLNVVCFFPRASFRTFITLLKVNWFLDILLYHKPLILDRCPVSGSLVGVPRWLPMDDFDALGSALQVRQHMCSYLPLVHQLLKGFDFAFWCFLSDDKAKMGCITSTCKRAEQAFPLSNTGARVSHWTLQLPQIFSLLSRLRNPLGTYLGVRIGSSPPLDKVALSALFRLSFQSPPPFLLFGLRPRTTASRWLRTIFQLRTIFYPGPGRCRNSRSSTKP